MCHRTKLWRFSNEKGVIGKARLSVGSFNTHVWSKWWPNWSADDGTQKNNYEIAKYSLRALFKCTPSVGMAPFDGMLYVCHSMYYNFFHLLRAITIPYQCCRCCCCCTILAHISLWQNAIEAREPMPKKFIQINLLLLCMCVCVILIVFNKWRRSKIYQVVFVFSQ